MSGPVDPEQLLEQREWALRLARSLVDDAQAAEDVAQEAVVSSWRERPERPRAWIARVVRNLAATRLRRVERRTRRERAAGRPEGEPGTDVLAARAEQLRLVVGAMLELPADAREVLLLRYVDDLPPSAIARRLGLPPGTVRSRLKRALDALRARLDSRSGGSRRAWAAPLAAWLIPARAAPAASLVPGGVLMGIKAKTLLFAALLMLVLLTGWSVRLSWPTGAPAPARTVPPREAREAPPAPGAVVTRDPAPAESVAVRGRVVTAADGSPIAGARVVALPPAPSRGSRSDTWVAAMRVALAPPPPVAETRSDADGAFLLSFARDMRVDLEASAPGHAPARLWGVDLSRGGSGYVLRLGPGATVAGRVVDAAGAPIAGAGVTVWRDGFVERRMVETGPDGRFELGGVEPGECALVVRKSGHCGRFVPHVEAPARGLEVELGACAPVGGIVLDARDGTPVVGARVVLLSNGVLPGPLPVETVTGGDGRWQIALAPRHGNFSLAVDGGSAGRVTAQVLTWEQRWCIERILLGPAVTLHGRVVLRGDRDTGVGGVPLVIGDETAGWGLGAHRAVSDPRGRFEFVGVGEVPGVVGVEDTPASDSPRWFLVEAGVPRWIGGRVDPDHELTVVVQRGARVAGVVVDAAGRPVADAFVRIDPRGGAARTDSGGRFELDAPPADTGTGEPRLTARAGARRVAEALRPLAPAERRAGLVLALPGPPVPAPTAAAPQGAASLSGRLLDGGGRPAGGLGVRAVRVQRFAAGNTARRVCGSTVSAPDGTWRIAGLPGEPLEIEVEARGWQPLSAGPFEAREEGRMVGDLALEPALELRGRVVDADGEGIAGVAVSASLEDPPHRRRAVLITDARGGFRYGDALPGAWRVELRIGLERIERTVALPAADPVVLVVESRGPRGRSIRGVVLDADGRPAPGAYLQAAPPGGDASFVPVALDGRFRIEGLTPGRYRIVAAWTHWSDDSYRARQIWLPLEVEAGTDGILLRATPGLEIRGSVVGATKERHPDLRVEARFEGEEKPPHGGTLRAAVDAHGRFALTGLHPGRYTLHLESEGARADDLAGIAAGSEDVVLRATPR